ncbi:MAG: glycerol-3-phosphate 1-O-acyltransferase [Myxococcota bacterium]|nr:glycerol-3-phosphate 1-O-acyltransferase [Myxococcota bacterium]
MPIADEPGWPARDSRPVVFLLDASSSLENRVLRRWIEETRPADVSAEDVEVLRIPASRRRPRRAALRRPGRSLEAVLAAPGDPLLAPLRVSWRPREREGVRGARFRDLWLLSDPRDPGRVRQSAVRWWQPDRCRVVLGEPAPLSELRNRWRDAGGSDAGETGGLASYVVRRAHLALERAERRLRGSRYKVPRFVPEEILARPSFRGAVRQLAHELEQPEKPLLATASRYLKEIAAAHDPFVIDLVARLIHKLYSVGYGDAIHYDRSQLQALYRLAQRHPVVFLPTHKSNLDSLALKYALHENGLPPNHTAAGINMNFFPVGPLSRRSGCFFIRRSFRDNPLYKLVLRSYIDYLIEKRFSLEWYIEGGRSRSGKLLPPMLGLLAYVVDAYRRGKSEDVILLPVSIAYDQIQDVGSYAAEQRGVVKQKESFGWFVGFVRALRRHYGAIHFRFGEPLSLSTVLGPPDPSASPDVDERNLELQKLAFEVCVRINRVTPITPTSLVTLALLGVGDRALTVPEIARGLGNLMRYVERRKLTATGDLEKLESTEGIEATLEALRESGVVTCFDEGPEAVWAIGRDQHLAAAYYRNTIIHFFVTGAIAELALLRAAEQDEGDAAPAEAFWSECAALRDLLKFEFFFSEKEDFQRELRSELGLHEPSWEALLAEGGESVVGLLRSFKPFSAHRILRPFLEAYAVVADHLGQQGEQPVEDEAGFVRECLALGRQYELQQRVRSHESVSKVLFQSALDLARNRGLLAAEGDGADLAARRSAFADEIRDAVRRVDAVDALAAGRRSGLVP